MTPARPRSGHARPTLGPRSGSPLPGAGRCHGPVWRAAEGLGDGLRATDGRQASGDAGGQEAPGLASPEEGQAEGGQADPEEGRKAGAGPREGTEVVAEARGPRPPV